MGKLFEKAFGVRPDEQPLVAGFFFLFVIIGMFYTVGVAVGDTLFLANVSAEEMPRLYPWVYVGIAAGTIGWAVAHHRLQAKISRFAYVVGTQLGIGLAVVVLRQLCELDTSWMFFILLVCLEVSALVYITLFFSFAGDYFSPRAARRVFGVIVGGMAVGTVAAGYLVRHAVDLMDTPDLLYVAAGLAMLGTLVSSLLFRIGTPLEDAVVIDERQVETLSVRHLARQRYLRAVGIAVTLTLVMAVLVDYQMKWVASDLPEAELAVFFGGFYEWVGLAQLAFQVLLVPPSLRILGIIN